MSLSARLSDIDSFFYFAVFSHLLATLLKELNLSCFIPVNQNSKYDERFCCLKNDLMLLCIV